MTNKNKFNCISCASPAQGRGSTPWQVAVSAFAMLVVSFVLVTTFATTAWAEEDKPSSWRFDNGELIDNPVTDSGSADSSSTSESRVATQAAPTTDEASRAATSSKKTSVGKLIDVSKWDEDIDWKKVKKSGINYAIIRCGYGSTGSDFMFKKNVAGARAAGVKIGVYLYSYAYTANMAKKEAQNTLNLMKAAGITSSNLALPVYYDLEEQAGKGKPCVKSNGKYYYISKSTLAAMAKAYTAEISKAGYKVGIYANKNWFDNYLTDKAFSNASWSKWVAQYRSGGCTYKGSYDIWQYSSTGRVSGISTNVDMNYLYRNFDPKVATATITPSNITSPLFVKKGTANLDLGGTLASNVTMRSATVSVRKGQTPYGEAATGSLVKSYTLQVNASTCNLSGKGLAEKLGFKNLSEGDYTYQITVDVEGSSKQVFADSFKVLASTTSGQASTNTRAEISPMLIDYAKPSSAVSGLSIPTGITKGKNLSFAGGKLTSSVPMTQVTVALVNAKTGKSLKTWTAKPNAKTMTLPSALSTNLATSGLGYGKYGVRVWVKSSSATTTAYSKNFTVGTAAPTVKTAKAGKKKFTAKWGKKSGSSGYQVRYSRYSSFKSDYFKTTKSTSKTIKVKKGKCRYYYQVRSYKLVGGVKCYGSWSSARSVKTK